MISTLIILLYTLFSDAQYSEVASGFLGGPGYDSPYDMSITAYGMNEPACSNFIRSNGSLGIWGTALIDAIKRVGTDCFYKEADFSVICPKYASLSPERKNQFLAFFFGAISFTESSCNQRVEAEGTNDTAFGFFQLEKSLKQREDAKRDPTFCGDVPDVTTIKFQMECAASIFAAGYCKKDNVPGVDSWYWQKLNPKIRQRRDKVLPPAEIPKQEITTNASKFPYC